MTLAVRYTLLSCTALSLISHHPHLGCRLVGCVYILLDCAHQYAQECPLPEEDKVVGETKSIPLLRMDQTSASKELSILIKKWQTRPPIIKGGPLCSPLVSDLVVVDLVSAPDVVIRIHSIALNRYIASSYTWSQPSFPRRLENGLHYSITDDLFLHLQPYGPEKASTVGES